jgi:hypothetical protein
MISFKLIGQYGRLGNQLFQYAAIRSLAVSNNWLLSLPETKYTWHSQECLLNNLNIPKDIFTPVPLINTKQSIWKEKDEREFDQSFFEKVKDGDDIIGFFQNTQYFLNNEELIKRELTPNEELKRKAKNYIESIRNGKQVISIHVRRGDIVEQTQGYNFYDSETGVFWKYLSKALTHFNLNDSTVLVFTGGSRNGDRYHDILWCKENLNIKNAIICEGFDDITDFTIMMSCDHNIMCHSSTFGWWASYLNPNKDKKVIAPQGFLAHDSKRIIHGFYPKEFTLI